MLRAPAFWWQKPSGLATVLAPAAALYGAISAARLAQHGVDVGIPIVCIGNLTLGGAGKTPTALAVAAMVQRAGHRPWFLSRGYGGRSRGPVTVDPGTHTAGDVGDEPLLLAQVAPTVVARNRAHGARYAASAGASLIVMDDGFQNPAVNKNLAVVVVDGRRGIGNAKVFPAGPLRAPLQAQLNRAQAMIVVGDIVGAAPTVTAANDRGLPVFTAALEPDAGVLAALAGRELLAFTGIADPEKFFRTLRQAGLIIRSQRRFPDHHRFTQAEASALLSEAAQQGLALVTTEKDAMRLGSDRRLAALASRTCSLPVRLNLHHEHELTRLLSDHLGPVVLTTRH
jgi:tetraacyldisaccharide 4'-kinase